MKFGGVAIFRQPGSSFGQAPSPLSRWRSRPADFQWIDVKPKIQNEQNVMNFRGQCR